MRLPQATSLHQLVQCVPDATDNVALAHVVHSAGTHVGDKAREACVELLADAFRETHEEPYMQATGALFAALAVFPELLRPIVE